METPRYLISSTAELSARVQNALSAWVTVQVHLGGKIHEIRFERGKTVQPLQDVYKRQEPFDAEYGVRGMVREKQKAYRNTYVKGNIIGGCFCVLSPIALCAGVFTENEFLITVMLSVTMLIAGIGVVFFIIAGVRWASMQKLLKEGEFSVQGKKVSLSLIHI